MKKQFGILVLGILFLALAGFGQSNRGKSFGAGAYVAQNAYGILGEYYWAAGDMDLSFRLAGLSAESTRDFEDNGWMILGNFYLHIPVAKDWLSFHLGIGGLYQSFEWKTASKTGTTNDFTFNGGAGFDFRITDYLGLGIEAWIVSDYELRLNSELELEKSDRYMRFAPAGTITFFF